MTEPKKRLTKQQKANQELLVDVQEVMKTRQGRKVLNYFITQGGYELSTFRGPTNETMHNCGMRSLAIQIFQTCQAASPGLNLKMIEERLNG